MATESWQRFLEERLARSSGPGLATLDQVRAMTGLAFLQAIVDGRLPQAPISSTLRFYLVEVERGRAVFQGVPGREQQNPLGSVHGGWAATLLDSAMACAVQTMLPAGQGYTTVEFKLNLVRPIAAEGGHLRAEGKAIHGGRTIATAEGRLFGEDGKLYAHGTETCMVVPF